MGSAERPCREESVFEDRVKPCVSRARIRIVLPLILIALARSASAQTENAAKVLSIQGSVERQQPPWVPIVTNSWLPVGATVRTGDQSRAVLLLVDETQLKINSNTELQLSSVRNASTLFRRVALAASHSQESVLFVSRGQVWLRARNKPADVKITTPAVTAAIRGTEFDLRVGADGESVVTVLEGSVDFRNTFGAVMVNTGEQGLARIGQAPSKIVLLNPTDAVQWTLTYSGTISPRDYPFRYASLTAARAALTVAGVTGITTAEARHDAGDLQGALEALSGLSTPDAAELRGWILLEQNLSAEALAEFERAPNDSERTRLGRSIAEYRLGRFNEAYRAVQHGTASTRLLVQRAQLKLIAGDVASARAALEAVPSANPAYAQAQALLSNVYLTQNRKEDARSAAERARAARPDSPSAYLALSLVEQSTFNLPAAIRAVQRARMLDPAFPQANIQYATLLFGTGETGKAEQVIRQVLATSPEEALAQSVLGFILLARGHNREARTSLDRALRLDSSQGEPHLGLGILAMREGHNEDAVTEFIEATTLQPRRSLYQTYLAKALYELRRFDQAFAALTAAEHLDPQDPTPHLYAGIFDNDLVKPGVAVRELQEAIRLNDGRAVYRSRFLLDEDLATKNVSLATAYARMGLTEWANLYAIKSEMADSSNSSAHLFLADTFLNLSGRLAAGGGELLMARLLMPANANSFNAFNNYTTLFDRSRANWSLMGTIGSFEAEGGTVIASGGTERLAYGSSWNYFRTDGFRPSNDDQKDVTGANLFKVALTPHSDMLLEYDHGNSRGGDHGGGLSSLVNETNNPLRRATGRTDRVEAGYHYQFRPGSDLVAFLASEADTTTSDDPQADFVFDNTGLIGFVRQNIRNHDPYVSYQAAHLLKVANFQIRYGLDIYQGQQQSTTKSSFVLLTDPLQEFPLSSVAQTTDTRYRTVFAQSSYAVTPALSLTAGINYDWANHDDIFLQGLNSTSRWDPNVAVIYSPNRSSTLRFAAMRVLQTHFQERIVPTQVAGFAFNQNEPPLTASFAYNAGWDQEVGKHTFVRTTAFKRNRTTPVGSLCALFQCQGELYGGAMVLDRILTDQWTMVSNYSLSHANELFSVHHDHDMSIGIFCVDPHGYSFNIQEEYFHQRGFLKGIPGLTDDVPVASAVFTTNVSFSYEFPRKRGLLSINVTNLLDRRYAFLADPLALDARVPKRQAALALQVNF